MGWDAFATKGGKVLKTTWNPRKRESTIQGKRIDKAFKAASLAVGTVYGSADRYLHAGGLDMRAAGDALRKHSGLQVFSPRGYSPARVRKAAAKAKWPKIMDADTAAARVFLSTCAKLGLGMKFDW